MAGRVSILQLDTRFPRVPGDVACPATYLGQSQIIRVPAATVGQIVSDRPDLIDITPFEAALAQATGDIIVTSCGFLSYWQDHLAALTPRPFIASALTALTELSTQYNPGEVLIVTFDAARLGPMHLGGHTDYAAGIVGLPRDMHLRQVITQDRPDLDQAVAEREMAAFVESALEPQHRHILLECTNLPPYKSALRKVTDLQISDILTQIERALPGAVHPQHLTSAPA